MIRSNLFNFKKDKEDASFYRISLKNSSFNEDQQGLDSLAFSKVFNVDYIKYFEVRPNKTLNANDYVFNFHQFMFYLYYSSRALNKTFNFLLNFDSKTNLYLKSLNKDFKRINDLVKATNIKLNSKYNKVKVFSVFKEKDFLETYDLYDDKRSLTFDTSMQSNDIKNYISSPLTLNKEINIACIEICEEETYGSDNLYQLDVTKDTSFIYRDNKVFNYIVGKKHFNETGQIKTDRNVSLCLILHFNGYQDLNTLSLETASAFNIEFDLNNLFYNENNNWNLLRNVGVNEFYNRKEIYFKRIRTNKIKLKLFQKKYYDTSFISDEEVKERNENIFLKKSYFHLNPVIKEKEIVKIYDLSLKDINVYRKVYKGFGFYRESEIVPINKPLSFVLKEEYIIKKDDSFIEKEMHIVLYGEKDFKAFKKKLNNYSKTPRVNSVVPLSNNETYEKELLIFENNKCILKLYPLTNSNTKTLSEVVKVYKNNVELTLSNDFEISFDNETTYLNDGDLIVKDIEENNQTKIAGDVSIRIKSETSIKDIYTCEYIKDTNFYLEDTLNIQYVNNEIVFNKNLNNSVGFLRTRFVFRNLNKENESSLIKEYKLLIEEVENDENNYIEYEDFIEIETKGIKNVIQ